MEATPNEGTEDDMAYRNLTELAVARIARRYGLKATDQCVIENAEEADSHHGKDAGKVYWATDSRGYYDAANLLEGYLSEMTREWRCDSMAAIYFEDMAYGRD